MMKKSCMFHGVLNMCSAVDQNEAFVELLDQRQNQIFKCKKKSSRPKVS